MSAIISWWIPKPPYESKYDWSTALAEELSGGTAPPGGGGGCGREREASVRSREARDKPDWPPLVLAVTPASVGSRGGMEMGVVRELDRYIRTTGGVHGSYLMPRLI